ncbi:hypothetical protein GYMLUDRAFT_75227 [Collybiopsis luxurians FD-317 M1]|uniref:Uncharacterized protein n=1 Tax=Collybiopsis luxurians FD-317 M1 TaxID=944289 RepID=A0A0D0B3W7_9AGAR|nr:hypothetical protein GYMLUDRAFT_75227 [Collybiopsis luxurians FD-317 M1]
MALNRCMEHVGEVAGLLTAAYAAFTDLRVELDVTRSNLQMISANNEMLEDALKNLSSQHGTNPRDVGWRRFTLNHTPSSTHVNSLSTDLKTDGSPHTENVAGNGSGGRTPLSPVSNPPSSPPLSSSESAQAMPPPTNHAPPPQESRFFKFRFNSSSSNSSSNSTTHSTMASRPQTPVAGNDSQSPTMGNAPASASILGRHRTALSSNVSLVGTIVGRSRRKVARAFRRNRESVHRKNALDSSRVIPTLRIPAEYLPTFW